MIGGEDMSNRVEAYDGETLTAIKSYYQRSKDACAMYIDDERSVNPMNFYRRVEDTGQVHVNFFSSFPSEDIYSGSYLRALDHLLL